MDKCTALSNSIGVNQMKLFLGLIHQHFPELRSTRTVMKIVRAVQSGNIVPLIQQVRIVVKLPEFQQRVVDLLDDLVRLAKDHKNLNALLTCYIEQGSPEMVLLLAEVFGLVNDLLRLTENRAIKRRIDRLRELSLAHMAYAERFMRRRARSLGAH